MAVFSRLTEQREDPPLATVAVFEELLKKAQDLDDEIWAREEFDRQAQHANSCPCKGHARSTRIVSPDGSISFSPPSCLPVPSRSRSHSISSLSSLSSQSSLHSSSTYSSANRPDGLSIPTNNQTSTRSPYPSTRPAAVPSSPSSYSESEPASDAEGGARKRGRKEKPLSQEQLESVRRRRKAKKQRRRDNGTARPRKRSASQKARKQEKKRAKREALSDAEDGPGASSYRLPPRAMEKWGEPLVLDLDVKFESETMSAAHGAYVGINRPVDVEGGADDYTVEGCRVSGKKYVAWDGV